MNTRKTIGKIFFALLWLGIGGGMLTLFMAAMGQQKKERCAGYVINIISPDGHLFIDKKDIEKIISKAVNGKITDAPVSAFNLRSLESAIEKSEWIRDAELYFDNHDVLHANIRERVPVARIFTSSGKSFYVDKDLQRLPLSEERTARLPVFTGFPEKKKLTYKDSLLLGDIVNIATYINNDPFWSAQTAQVDHHAGGFDIIPVVGNHLIRFGNGSDIEKKFRRLKIFYSNVLPHTGIDRYKEIDVRFNGQVVGVRNSFASKIDSVAFRKNIEKLMYQSRELPQPVQLPAKTEEEKEVVPVATGQELMETENPSQDSIRRPKAVMPARQQ